MRPLLLAGRYGFGLAIAGSGVMQVLNGEYVRLASNLPGWLGASPALPVTSGVLLVLIGGAIVTGYRLKVAALLFAVLMLATFILKGIPDIAANPGAGYVWTNPAKMLALLGGALVLGGRSRAWPWLAQGLLGLFLIICGVQHFLYAGFVDTLVPAWIPPGQRFWTYFAAVALLLGGVGVLPPRTRWVAGVGSGVMIFAWVVLVHLARTLQLRNAFELAGVFEALAIGGVAWLVAEQDAAAEAGPVSPKTNREPFAETAAP